MSQLYSACCRKKLNTAGGWCWIYYEDYVEQNPDEEWREIEITSQKFRVSSLGRVQLTNGLITKGSLHAGYYRIGWVYKYQVHRLVAFAFSPNEEGKEYVNHNATNNRASSLEWCTSKENVQHAVHLGLCSNNPGKRASSRFLMIGSIQEFPSIADNVNIGRVRLIPRTFFLRGTRSLFYWKQFRIFGWADRTLFASAIIMHSIFTG
ncbi:His-Me finger endonuclease [Rhizophagus irregularis]|uniref:His-Me finger endonuclease n=1 Tax=Rhizophagus irregularis TaxID=588596 RepID=A0A2N1NDS8_9GLOM|nr:His-Me finger endonuclease [Rhizophagus irregularis]